METIEDHLKGQPNRLIILAACAFARTVEHLLTAKCFRDAIETAERFADRLATKEDVLRQWSQLTSKPTVRAGTAVWEAYFAAFAMAGGETADAARAAGMRQGQQRKQQ